MDKMISDHETKRGNSNVWQTISTKQDLIISKLLRQDIEKYKSIAAVCATWESKQGIEPRTGTWINKTKIDSGVYANTTSFAVSDCLL
jgi:hypothetical protein